MQHTCKIHGLVKHYESKNRKICSKCSIMRVTRRRKELKIRGIEYLGGKCKDCNLKDDCPGVYDFHHLDSNLKSFNISKSGHIFSWENVKLELNKCILLCANCHRKRHFKNEKFLIKRVHKIYKCNDCSEELKNNTKRCRECNYKFKLKINWPNKEYLISKAKEIGYVALGKELGVSDNAIRKRIAK